MSDFQPNWQKMSVSAVIVLKPFSNHQSHYNGSGFFCYNSQAATAREMFDPSTDAESLLGSTKKNIF